jgi:hypothetical protein
MITGVPLFSYSVLILEALDLFFAKEMLVDPAPFLGLPPCGAEPAHSQTAEFPESPVMSKSPPPLRSGTEYLPFPHIEIRFSSKMS